MDKKNSFVIKINASNILKETLPTKQIQKKFKSRKSIAEAEKAAVVANEAEIAVQKEHKTRVETVIMEVSW